MKKVKKNIEEQQRKNQDWYDRRYNEDATQRADAQRILTITQENIRQRNQQAAGTQAVMGGTEESVAAARAANNQALADQSQLNNLEINKANAISQAVQGVAKAGAGIAGAL